MPYFCNVIYASHPTVGRTRIDGFKDEGHRIAYGFDKSIKNNSYFILNGGQMINRGLNLTDFLSQVHDCTFYINEHHSMVVCTQIYLCVVGPEPEFKTTDEYDRFNYLNTLFNAPRS